MRFLILCLAATPALAGWKMVEPGWNHAFPRDHGSHPEFKTEWWYFTGNMKTAEGREFGWQLTFFRQGVLDPDQDFIPLSRFVTRDVKFAHFAVSDLTGRRFHFHQKLSRGAFGEAGFDDGTRLAWIEDWSCEQTGPETFRLRAAAGDTAIDLELQAQKPPVIHGESGVSRKGEGPGNASHYYSMTRLAASGSLRAAGENFPVEGMAWFDHEWMTNPLKTDQTGWNWFSLQFGDGSELMLFQLRSQNQDGTYAAGTFVDAQGRVTSLAGPDIVFEPLRQWKSPATGGSYPVEWRVAIPKLELAVAVRAALDDQELALSPIAYWEGAVRANGARGGHPLTAQGYLEMTGYAGPVAGLQGAP